MKKQYDEYLCSNYPKLYKDRHGDMTKTCMVWGFDTGDGWFNILNGLSMMIQAHINSRTRERWRIRKGKRKYALMSMTEQVKNAYLNQDMPPRVTQVIVAQVKEKFGGLRFYYDGGDEAIREYVSMAEAMSYITCEECGAPGSRSDGGWIKVVCYEHGGKDIFAVPLTKEEVEEFK